jgi:cytochrome c2
MKQLLVASTLISAGLLCHPLAAVAGPTEGKTVFDNQCSNCHTTVVGKNGFGPSLAEVIGRSSGGLADYHYSTAMATPGSPGIRPRSMNS